MRKNKLLALLIFIFPFAKGHCNFQFYPYRDISNPIVKTSEFEKFIIISPVRSGSTVVYAIVQYLLEDKLDAVNSFNKKVVKLHNFERCAKYMKNHKKALAIVCVRHPIESLESRIRLEKELSEEKLEMIVNEHVRQYKNLLELMFSREYIDQIIVARYEFFVDDILFIASMLEEKLNKKVNFHIREQINLLFSKNAVKKLTSQYKSFSEYDPILGFHGNHIQEHLTLEELVGDDTLLEYTYQVFSPICKKLGYTISQSH